MLALALEPGRRLQNNDDVLTRSSTKCSDKSKSTVCRKRRIRQDEGMSSFIRTPRLAYATDVHNPSPRASVSPHACQIR